MTGSVTPITRVRDRLIQQIRAELLATGHAYSPLEHVDPAVWRRCARAAARSLGRPVRTLQFDDGVHAGLTDWPATPAEETAHQQRMRRAVETAAAGIDVRPPLRPVD